MSTSTSEGTLVDRQEIVPEIRLSLVVVPPAVLAVAGVLVTLGGLGQTFTPLDLIGRAPLLLAAFVILAMASRMSVSGYRVLALPLLVVAVISLLAGALLGPAFEGAPRYTFTAGGFQIEGSSLLWLGVVLWVAGEVPRHRDGAPAGRQFVAPGVLGALAVLLAVTGGGAEAVQLILLATALMYAAGARFTAWALFGAMSSAALALVIKQSLIPALPLSSSGCGSTPGARQSFMCLTAALDYGGTWGQGVGMGVAAFSRARGLDLSLEPLGLISVQLGLAGVLFMLALSVLPSLTGFVAAQWLTDEFARLSVIGIAWYMLTASCLNVSESTGLIPALGFVNPWVQPSTDTYLIANLAGWGAAVAMIRATGSLGGITALQTPPRTIP